jgi:hypothetical protein
MVMTAILVRVDMATLKNYQKDSFLLEDKLYDEGADEDDEVLNLGKSWDGIIYLLTSGAAMNELGARQNQVFYKIFKSETVVDEKQDFGSGPAHYLDSDTVREIYNKICDLSTAQLTSRFDAEKMTQAAIYPAIWKEKYSLTYLLDSFDTLRLFYKQAIDNEQVIISVIV